MTEHALGAELNNKFNYDYYASIITAALAAGYTFLTLRDFIAKGCPKAGHFILRHDLDLKPLSLAPMLEVERTLGVPSTVFTRVMGAEYNPFGYTVFPVLRQFEALGGEVGLHTNFLEFATFNKLNPFSVLETEISSLAKFFDISGIACHRDINYQYNSLPLLEMNWESWKSRLGISYQAYQKSLFDASVYVNEGFTPHLCWRRLVPEDVIPSGDTIYLLTHSHWWHKDHPYEF